MDKLTPVAELTDGASVQLAGHSYIMPPAPFGVNVYAPSIARWMSPFTIVHDSDSGDPE